MTNAELTWLTNDFGHSKNVHYAWYHIEDSRIELTKEVRVLMAVDEGHEIRNNNIEEVLEEERETENESEERTNDVTANVDRKTNQKEENAISSKSSSSCA